MIEAGLRSGAPTRTFSGYSGVGKGLMPLLRSEFALRHCPMMAGNASAIDVPVAVAVLGHAARICCLLIAVIRPCNPPGEACEETSNW